MLYFLIIQWRMQQMSLMMMMSLHLQTVCNPKRSRWKNQSYGTHGENYSIDCRVRSLQMKCCGELSNYRIQGKPTQREKILAQLAEWRRMWQYSIERWLQECKCRGFQSRGNTRKQSSSTPSVWLQGTTRRNEMNNPVN